MPNDQALYWLGVMVLLGFTMLLGQAAAAAIAGVTSILLAYRNSPTLWKSAPETTAEM